MDNAILKHMAPVLAELPPGSIVYKTMSKTWTREQMLYEVVCETHEGKVYCSEVLRLARDMIARNASK